MSEKIGEAYIQIEPSMQGITGKINKELGIAGQSGGQTFNKGFASVLGTAGKVAAGAAAAGAAAVSGIVTSATKSFGDYEQLVGGIETLFGDSAETVIGNAERAFNTAGMSMNDYMETSIQSAAAMINSLGGDQAKASQLMDMSITDMADNVNKMGTSMQSVQDAYRGFSRGNFTMLDNLALGFAGTKEGMQQLLDKAKEISGVEYNIDSYSDIVQAIHTVQTEMGISGITAQEAADMVSQGLMTEEEAFAKMGTTAKEANTTLQGSLSALQGAWQNTLTGMATGGADMSGQIQNLVETAKTFIENLTPVIETALNGVSTVISQLAPVLSSEIPALLQSVLPQLLQAGTQIVESLAEGILEAIPSLMPTITQLIVDITNMFVQMLPQLITVGLQIIQQLADGIAQALPQLMASLTDVTLQIIDTLTNPETFTALIDTGVQIILNLADGILQALPQLVEKAPEIITNLVQGIVGALPILIDGAIQLVEAVVGALPEITQGLVDAAPQIVEALATGLIEAAPQLMAAGPQLVISLVAGLVSALPQIVTFGPRIIASIIQGLMGASKNLADKAPVIISEFTQKLLDSINKLIEAGKTIVMKIINGLESNKGSLMTKGISMIGELKNQMLDKVKEFGNVGKGIVDGIKEGLAQSWDKVSGWFKDKISGLKKTAQEALDINSPSKVFADEVGVWIPAGIAQGIEKGMSALDQTVAKMTSGMVGSSASLISTEAAASSQYAPEIQVEYFEAIYELMAQYLPKIADGENVSVEVTGDIGRLFRAMKSEQAKEQQLVGV